MKRFLLLILIILEIFAYSEIPQKFKYQSVLRNKDGNILVNKEVKINIYITDKSDNELYSESFTVKTSVNGIINFNIGEGSNKSGNFSDIDWSVGEIYIEFGVDSENSGVYEKTGKTQFLSVPYAIHASTADKITGLKYEDIEGIPELISSLKNDVGYISVEKQNLAIKNDSLYLINTQNTNFINLSKYNEKSRIDSIIRILNLNYYNKTEIDQKISAAGVGVSKIYTDTNLGKKADTSNTYKKSVLYTKIEIDNRFSLIKKPIDTAKIYYSALDDFNINVNGIIGFENATKTIYDKQVQFTLNQNNKYFIFVVPDSWSEPQFYYSANNDALLNVFDKLKTVIIDGVNYAVWVSNEKFPVSSLITMK